MDVITPPQALSLSINGDNNSNWLLFKQRFECYLLTTEKTKKPDNVKVALLLNIGGSELEIIHETLDFPPPTADVNPAETLEVVSREFDAHFTGKKNEVIARYPLRRCKQNEDENIESFIAGLKLLIKDCNYEDTVELNKAIRDGIVIGCRSDKLRQKLFECANLTLSKTIDICTAHQASEKTMNEFKGTAEQNAVIN